MQGSAAPGNREFLPRPDPAHPGDGRESGGLRCQRLVLTAPLEANHNHLGTAFGGSLSAIATLAGYGLLWLTLGDRSAHIVVRSSRIRYRHPVKKSIHAIARPPAPDALDSFIQKFQTTGKAGIRLQVEVVENDRVCVEFDGLFVAIR